MEKVSNIKTSTFAAFVTAVVVALDPVGETATLLLQPAPVKSHDLLVMWRRDHTDSQTNILTSS